MANVTSLPVAAAEVRRVVRTFPSYRDFVDAALFHPAWGYYSTGAIRFGEGGHYATFPLALSPVFGRMLARYTYRFWQRAGRPQRIEICEVGAGNGQLALDVLVCLAEGARRQPAWQRFADALRYRIIERSVALIDRQRRQLGPLAARVRWTRADLARRAARGAPFGAVGVVFANEVLDCLAHHKVVRLPGGDPGVVFVVPALDAAAARYETDLETVAGSTPGTRAIPWSVVARLLSGGRARSGLRFTEVVVPLAAVPPLRRFLRRYCPALFPPSQAKHPYFACPAVEPLMRNTARLYRRSEALWIDYGETQPFHLRAAEAQRVFAGPPRSGASVYRAPGLDDITFLVDFSVVAAAARRSGWRVEYYGPQGELARRSRETFDRGARDLILQYRTLGWMLAVSGLGPERAWRHTGLTWQKPAGTGGGRLRDDVADAVAEFTGRRTSNFKLLVLSRTPARRFRAAGAGRRSRRCDG